MRTRWIVGGVAFGVTIALLLSVLSFRNGRTADMPILENIPEQGKILGLASAPVLVEIFSDYQCPYCAVAALGFEKNVAQKHVAKGQVRMQFRDFPFLGMESWWAAVAAGCAAQQNKFWAYHDKIFSAQKGKNQGAFSPQNLKQWAKDLSLDVEAFNACFDTESSAASIREDYNWGKEHYKINSTPTFFVNGRKFVGIPDEKAFDKAVAEELAKRK